MTGAGAAPGPRLLDPRSTAAVVLGAHDWTEAGLGRSPSFLRSARGVVAYLYDQAGLGLDPELVLDLFDSGVGAGEQLAEIRDALDARLRERRGEGRPVIDVLVYYVGHGHTDEQGHLSLLVRRSRRGMEAETGVKAPDLARVLKVAAPQQRRVVVLDCCFSEAAARGFIGMSPSLDQAVAATAAKDLGDDQPRRGTLLLCSSPVGEVSMGPPNATRTLFTGAVLDVLRQGAEGKPVALSFADLRDAAYRRMVVSFGANAPRPVLHQVNAAHGDLTRTPAFPNRKHARSEAAQGEAEEKTRRDTARRRTEGKARHETDADETAAAFAAAAPRPVAAGTPALLGPTSPPSPPARPPRPAWREWSAIGVVAVVLVGIGVSLGTNRPPPAPALAPSVVAPSRSPEENFRLGAQRERESNHAEAARLYRAAADQGHAAAQYTLGAYYEQGVGGLAKDGREAALLYRLAAGQGHAEAKYNLGRLYEQGRGGLVKDVKEAIRQYQAAARGGSIAAQQALAGQRQGADQPRPLSRTAPRRAGQGRS